MTEATFKIQSPFASTNKMCLQPRPLSSFGFLIPLPGPGSLALSSKETLFTIFQWAKRYL